MKSINLNVPTCVCVWRVFLSLEKKKKKLLGVVTICLYSPWKTWVSLCCLTILLKYRKVC